jgi:hypothetical protein
MAIYKPKATLKTWNDTNNWQFVRSVTQSRFDWADTASLPTNNDDVWMDGKQLYIPIGIPIYANRILPHGQPGSTAAQSPAPLLTSSNQPTAGTALLITASNSTYYISASTISGTSEANAIAFNVASGATNVTVYLSASIDGGEQYNQNGLVVISAASCSMYINGNIYGGGLSSIYSNVSSTKIFMTGSLYGPNTNVLVFNRACIFFDSNATLSTASILGSVYDQGKAPLISSAASRSLVEIKGTIVGSSSGPTYSGSMSAALSQSFIISGSVINHPFTGQQAIYTANRVYIHSSSLGSSCKIQIKPYPAGNVELVDPNFGTVITYPAENNVVSGYAYGNGQTGTMRTPLPRDVRNEITYTTASRVTSATTSTWQVLQVQGACYMPHSSSVRVGVSYDSTSTPGAMLVPSQSQTQWGAFFSTSSLTGSYQSASQYWSTSSNSFTQVSSSGYLLSRSLDVALGTITGSFVADLNNINTNSNTIRRMQNVHTTQSVSQSIGVYL